jgi:4-amino-4-deoxy-L-arabinose transferase-like glycosyltransferase
VVAALVARELGGGRRAQALAALIVGFSPLLVATNGLFQPVSFDHLATMLVLWLVLRLLLGRGSWLPVGVAVGIGLETKYTLAVVVVLAAIAVVAWRRDVVGGGLLLSALVAAALVVPNLAWQAQHGWVSLHWFLDPPASATDESRSLYIANVLLLTHPLAVPVAVRAPTRLHPDASATRRGELRRPHARRCDSADGSLGRASSVSGLTYAGIYPVMLPRLAGELALPALAPSAVRLLFALTDHALVLFRSLATNA